MKILKSCGNALTICAAAMILASCGGSPSPIASGVIPQSASTATGLPATRSSAAQMPPNNHRRLPGYAFYDLGTLGGPQSDMQGDQVVVNERNQAFGVAETSAANPYYPNFNPLLLPVGIYSGAADPYLFHAFAWGGSGLTDLGALPGTNDSVASHAGPNGEATGASENGMIDPLTGWPEARAVLWSRGKIVDLGTLGGYESAGSGMNARGQVAGIAANTTSDPYSFFGWGTQTRGFIWEKATGMRDIGTLGGPDAGALFINARSQIAGFSYTNAMAVDPFIWEHNKMTDLGSLGGTFGGPWGLNESGDVTGNSNLVGDEYGVTHPFLWQHGRLRDLGTLGGTYGIGTALNNAAQVAGFSFTSGNATYHAFRWSRGVMKDLGALDSYCNSNANGINARGDVVGASTSCDYSVSHAYLWTNGTMIDLNDYVPPSSMLTFGEALYINDRGAIAGHATLPNGEFHAVVLIPSDDPSVAAKTHVSYRFAATTRHATPDELLAFILRKEARMRHMPWPTRFMRP
jgi:probable HAF family extracellular repeat protein